MSSSYCAIKVLSLLALGIIGLIADGVNGKAPSRLTGGRPASPGEFKYIVSVMKYRKHFCGGAIISPRHILTAAHCLLDLPETITIRTGVTDLNDHRGQEHRVSAIHVNPHYQPRESALRNDIAVIVLVEPLMLNEKLVKLNLPSYQVGPGDGAMFAGWGSVSYNRTQSSHLQKLPVSFLNETTCVDKESILIPETLCGYSPFGTLCGGDSGSPLVLESAIVGIASASFCRPGVAHVYTNVYYYRTWILNLINYT